MALAAGLPLMAYLATASGYAHWFDSGEFVAVATDFGVPHPPGHPLAGVLMGAATLLPLGSLAFRVALLSALLAGLAAAFLYRAILLTLSSLGLVAPALAIPLALAATWTVSLSYGWWFQGVRPEVYALQAALLLLALERLITLEHRWPTLDLRPLYVASFALGLGLANHHLLAFLALPAGAPTLARVMRARGPRPIGVALLFLLLGLLTYVYLLARGAASPFVNMGEPTSLARLFWVVSAQAFQGNTGDFSPQPLDERFLDVLIQLFETLHPVTLVLALGGAYTLLRSKSSRRVGYLWVSTFVVFILARTWLGFVRSNPDALGYLMPALAATGALAASFVGALFLFVGSQDPARPSRLVVFLACAFAAASLLQLGHQGERSSLANFNATDAFDDPMRRDLPPRAIVLLHQPESVFRYWGGEAEEHLRPDVVMLPMPFLNYPGMVSRLVRETPELRELLRGHQLEGELIERDLQSLAARRPLFVELDPRVPAALHRTLVPAGLYHRVLPDGATLADEAEGAEDARRAFRQIEERSSSLDDPATDALLLWRHYMAALYFASFGDRAEARLSLREALTLNPVAEPLVAMQRALADEEATGPLDITPFLP